MTAIDNPEIRDKMEKSLMEVAGLTSRREYNMALLRARQTAEMIIRCYADENRIEYTKLHDTIEELYRMGAISRTSRDNFHNIRVYGNKAAHEADNEADDARNAYYLLKEEMETYMSHKMVSIDRTPVRVERDDVSNRRPAYTEDGNRRPDYSGNSGQGRPGRGYDGDGYGSIDTDGFGRTGSPERSGNGQRSERGRAPQKKKKQQQQEGFNIYTLLKILIPLVVIILLIVIVSNLISGKDEKKQEETTIESIVETEPVTEPVTEPETEPPTTEAPKPVEYQIKGDGVNIRFADQQDRIYTQLNNGVKIGPVEEIEGSDFVKFRLDDKDVVVRKDFIAPVQE